MPIYQYQPERGSCRLCGDGFDWVETGREGPLKDCPKCGLAVKRKDVHPVQTPKIMKPVGPAAARNAGFTMMRRVGKGEYERLD